MANKRSSSKGSKHVETFRHNDASRRNIPTAEHEPLVEDNVRSPIQFAYERRNRDLDPQLVWRGKDEQDESDLFDQVWVEHEGVERQPSAGLQSLPTYVHGYINL